MATEPTTKENNEDGVKDLFEIFTEPLSEMTEDQLIAALASLREVRKIKVAQHRQAKSTLDLVLSSLSVDDAKQILQKIDQKLESKQKDVKPEENKT